MLFQCKQATQIMKRIKMNLAVLMVILGTGAAFAGSGTFQTPTLYNDAPPGFPTHWASIPSGATVSCDGTNRLCTAYVVNGVITPTTSRGFATLIH